MCCRLVQGPILRHGNEVARLVILLVVKFNFHNILTALPFLIERFQSIFIKALFSSEKISDFGTVAFSFLFDKYYSIID